MTPDAIEPSGATIMSTTSVSRSAPSFSEVRSEGGFPPGITVDNIYRRQLPRNRRLADACARIGWVERSGQGADRMKDRKSAPLAHAFFDRFDCACRKL